MTFSILIVDDEPDNFDVIEAFLSSDDYHLHYVESGEKALATLPIQQPDLILMDVMMPGIDGLALCKQIKAMSLWQSVPIIMVTALASKHTLAQCLEAGADDFVSKPINRMELTARVRSMLRIRQQYQQLNSFNAQLEAKVAQRTAELQTLLYQDSLTQLPSRINLLERVGLLQAEQRTDFALAYLDCDQFKLVNGAFGYTVGNQLLQAIAERLQQHLRPGDVLARVGEDEFCFLLTALPPDFSLPTWIEAVLQSFHAPFQTSHCEIFMTACLGLALGDSTTTDPEALLQAADTAMYRAKRQGKGCHQWFNPQLHAATLHRLTLENDLQHALSYGELVVYYQPIICLATHRVMGLEALVRWQHPERGLVPPGEFIPCLEETGLVVRAGLVVLRQACQQLRDWHEQGWTTLTVAVNLSVRQFASPTLLADIDQVLAETGANPAYLKLEITESAIMENAEAASVLMDALRERRIQISIDDFGTGYSSLGYLHRFPLDVLKIDRSFVRDMHRSHRNYQVVETIITLSNQLDLAVVAEGIETQDQLQALKKLGCELGQGFFFAKPAPAEAITTTLRNQPLGPVPQPAVRAQG
ncbi:GGDEF domain-containing response regulator [Leptolyngbya sp. BL0902]|uniref:two-component system response regulator n=1 Tax=Leptolyngbya sp. BL0902 TaxID=1115757 RepID=UPI0018E7D51D|nr:EAL domain-containing protein [Leptolyngbya sp. BL0902]QQE66938.1 GGDEF domain-containing response regulator [Leptolyngbya sp. BL0902]